MQIIILGMHRSGTSTVARLLNMMGAYFAPPELAMPANENNEKGYWERWDVFWLHENMLRELGWAWDRVSGFDAQCLAEPDFVAKFRPRAEKILLDLDARRPWMFKDPRLNLLLPFWKPLLEAPVCIHVHRSPIQVAQSLHKREGFPLSMGLALWEQYSLLGLAHSEGIPRVLVSYHELMAQPVETTRRLHAQLLELQVQGLRLPSVREIEAFIEPRLYHQQGNPALQSSYANAQQARLDQAFNDGDVLSLSPLPTLSAGATEILRSHEDQQAALARFNHLRHRREQIDRVLRARRTAKIEQQAQRVEQQAQLEMYRDREQAAEGRIVALEQRLKYYETTLERLRRWLVALAGNIEAVFGTLTWRAGNLLTQIALTLMLRKPDPGARGQILQIFQEMATWWRTHPDMDYPPAPAGVEGNALPGPARYADVAQIANQSWRHRQSRDNEPDGVLAEGNFDEDDYLAQYPDVRAAVERGEFASGREHFQLRGCQEIVSGARLYVPGFSSKRGGYPELIDLEQCRKDIARWPRQPRVSIIMPVYNVEPRWLELAIRSVKQQIYPNWELCVVDDCSTRQETLAVLRQIDDPRFKVKFLENNRGIAGASNAALALAEGEYIAFLDHDDELTPDALYQVIKIINQHDPDLIYSDEDKLSLEGCCLEPHFKPDYSPDLILSTNYICHLSVYRKALLDQAGSFREGFEGSQDHDLVLRALDHTNRVHHIPHVLYHWRMIPGSTAAKYDSKNYAWEAGRRAIEDTLRRRGIAGKALLGQYPGTYRVKRIIQGQPRISIIIPFHDHPDLLRQCLDSILEKTSYPNFELLGVSNNSVQPDTFAVMEHYSAADRRIRFIRHDVPFNYAAINNFAACQVEGEHLLLLNNDMAVITPDWLEALLEHSQRPEVGAVGAKLYYPDDTIQHGGVIIGVGGIAGHAHRQFQQRHPGYFARLHLIQNLSAVTGACLMVKKSLYEAIGGMDEKNLPVAFNDVDFCLRLREQGYLNVFTPYCELYHHESKTRGGEDTPQKKQRFTKEIAYMRKRHAAVLQNGDPYYNPNLPLDRGDFGML